MNDKDSGIYAVEDRTLHDAHVRALTTYREHNDEHSFESWKSFYAERRALVRQRNEREQTPARSHSELDSREAALAAINLKLEVLRKESEVASPYQIRQQKVRDDVQNSSIRDASHVKTTTYTSFPFGKTSFEHFP